MKNLKLLSLGILLAIGIVAKAQQTKPEFKSLTYVTYETTASQKAVIKDIVEIDAQGNTHFRSIYYNGVADTTYQLSDAKIEQLNLIFNGKKPLKTFMITTKLNPGEHYGGSFEYLTYTNSADKVEEFIVVMPFMNNDFKKALDRLVFLPHKISYKGKEIKAPKLEAKIINAERNATYLPKIEQPPTMMN